MTSENLKYIEEIDFSLIKRKMSDTEDGLGWDEQKISVAECEYKNFLKLLLLYPDQTFVPSHLIDEFWHFHILDTRKYYADCIRIYGHLIHHYPYFGMNGEDDKKQLETCFEETKTTYKYTFLTEMNMSYSSRCGGSSCGGKCSKCNTK